MGLENAPFIPLLVGGCGKIEAHIICSMVTCKMTAPVTGITLRFTGPVRAVSRQ